MFKLLTLIIFVLNVTLGIAQSQFLILDQVTNSTLEDVHIYIKQNNNTRIFVSQEDGIIHSDFTLNLGDEIKITHIGYETIHHIIKKIIPKYTFRLIPLSTTLDNVILTGEMTPISKNESIYEVTTISEKEIEQLGALDATQVLQWQNGVQVNRDPILGSSVSINGLSGEHVKVIVDGIEINGRSDGYVDLEQIQIQDKQSVEIVKGPVSLEYGSNAMGGVVQFVSQDQDIRDSVGLRVKLYAENTGTYKTSLHFVEAGKKHSLNAYFDRSYFDGWKESDVFWEGFKAQIADSSRVKSWNPKRFVNGKIKYDLTLNSSRITTVLFYQNEKISEKGSPFVAPFYSKAKDSELNAHRFYAQSQLKSTFNDHHLYQVITNIQLYKRYRDSYIKDLSNLSILPQSTVSDTTAYNSYQVKYQAKYLNLIHHKLDYGFDVLYDEIIGERIESTKQHQVAYGFYLKDKYEINSSVLIQGGIRLSHFLKSKIAITPSLSTRINLNKHSILKLSLSRGFRNPGLKDLYFEFIDNNHHIIGNSELKPEQSYHFNGGFTHQFKNNWHFDVGSFMNSMSNKIELVQSTEQANWFTYDNFSKYEGLGGHFGLGKKYRTWNFTMEYQLMTDRVLEDRVPDNWVKSHQISSRILTTINKCHQLTLSGKWNSKRSTFRFDSDGNTLRYTQDAFVFLDLGYRNSITKHLDIGIWLKNLLDVTSIANTNTTAHSSAQQNIARGRMLQLLIAYKL